MNVKGIMKNLGNMYRQKKGKKDILWLRVGFFISV